MKFPNEQTQKELDNFLQNLKDAQFYDAHENLEAVWFPRRFEKSDEIKLIKGFINASVSFELFKKDKIESSKKVWNNYLKYKNLIYAVNSIHSEKYRLIMEEIEKIKKNFMK